MANQVRGGTSPCCAASRPPNEKMHRPIFYDASGRRRRLTLPALSLALMAILVAAIAFAVTIVDVPVPPAVPLRMERPRPEGIGQRLGRLGASLRGELAGWLPHRGRALATRPVSMAFYVPWDDASKARTSDIDEAWPVTIWHGSNATAGSAMNAARSAASL